MSNKVRVSEWMLERLLLDELPPEEKRALEARLAADPEAAAKLEALRMSNQEILESHPVEKMAQEIERRARRVEVAAQVEKDKSAWSVRWRYAPLLAGLAVLLVVAVPSLNRLAHDTDTEDTRVKGLEPHLKIYRKTGNVVAEVSTGSLVAAGDWLQVSYVTAGQRYGVILSVDGNGVVTLHAPTAGGTAFKLKAEGEVLLPQAYELDAAPGFERFFLVTSERPFSTATVEQAARSMTHAERDPLPLPRALQQRSILLRKR